jgi:hypothetical protein
MVFLYYLPRISRAQFVSGEKLSAALLAERGLGEVLRDVTHWPEHATISDLNRGPDGGQGVLVVPTPGGGTAPDVAIFQEAHQHWTAARGGDLWIGYQLTKPPTPESLQRNQTFAGYWTTDASDRKWIVPVARSPKSDGVTLPKVYRFDEAGKPVGRVDAAFESLWSVACELSDWWGYTGFVNAVESGQITKPERMPAPPDVADHDDSWMVGVALQAIGVNYRIGPIEANVLAEATGEIFSTAFVMNASLALIDRHVEIEYWQKKTREAAPSVSDSQGSPIGAPEESSIAPALAS